jgi:hypothetical protein
MKKAVLTALPLAFALAAGMERAEATPTLPSVQDLTPGSLGYLLPDGAALQEQAQKLRLAQWLNGWANRCFSPNGWRNC